MPTVTCERKKAEEQQIHNKHEPRGLLLDERRTGRHNVQSEEVSSNGGPRWREEKIEPVKAWTGVYLWQNHMWKEHLPFDGEKMKGEDKKWLLIDCRFIYLDPDDHTMQSNSDQEGAKVLMGF